MVSLKYEFILLGYFTYVFGIERGLTTINKNLPQIY